MRVDENIEVDAERERVWRYVSEPERYGEFMVGSSWEPVPGEPTTGARARFSIAIEAGSTEPVDRGHARTDGDDGRQDVHDL